MALKTTIETTQRVTTAKIKRRAISLSIRARSLEPGFDQTS
jgi:hypothetical protein